MPRGLIALVLHAHLPYVRHRSQQKPEGRWLFEALTESYLPLVDVLLRLVHDRVEARVALSVSPTLASMLRDPLLMGRYGNHLDELCELLVREERRARRQPAGGPDLLPLVRFYQQRVARACRLWDALACDLVGGLVALEEAGAVELLTSAATHAFLPHHAASPGLVEAQVGLGMEHHELLFGRRPRGCWLPECGYEPGLEALLQAQGVGYFCVDTHGLTHADPAPRLGVRAPVVCPGGQVACFGRDPACSKQIWSATEGYPADPWYREFFRDICSERTAEELGGLAAPTETGEGWFPTGLKYHRITGATEEKALYEPAAAAARVRVHARHFIRSREAAVRAGGAEADGPPRLMVAPFDAELFGHWWLEGPLFLEEVLRGLGSGGHPDLELVTPSQYLDRWPRLVEAAPSASSWGDGGYGKVWLDSSTAWIQRQLQVLGRRLLRVVGERGDGAAGVVRRALEQTLRELLLAQASDWPFLIRAGTARDYAEARVRSHLEQVGALLEPVASEQVDESELARLEQDNPLFPGLDVLSSVYCNMKRQ